MSALRLALVAGALVGCVRSAPLVGGEPYVRGPVESISGSSGSGRILVAGGPGSSQSCGLSAGVDGRTRYLTRWPAGRIEPASFPGIAVGDTVEVFVTGPIAESCPPQGRAAVVVRVARS